MRFDPVLAGIAGHVPADAAEAANRRFILDYLGRGGNPFDRRRFDPGHLTASAFVLDAAGECLLMLHHRRLGLWLQPGGHGEPGEGVPLAIATREVLEETGIAGLAPHPGAASPFDLDVHAIPARASADPTRAEPAHRHLDIRFLLRAPPEATPHANAESRAVRWVPLPEAVVLAGRDPGLVRAIGKIGRLLGVPPAAAIGVGGGR